MPSQLAPGVKLFFCLVQRVRRSPAADFQRGQARLVCVIRRGSHLSEHSPTLDGIGGRKLKGQYSTGLDYVSASPFARKARL